MTKGTPLSEKVKGVFSSVSVKTLEVSKQTKDQFTRCFKTLKTGKEVLELTRDRNYLGRGV